MGVHEHTSRHAHVHVWTRLNSYTSLQGIPTHDNTHRHREGRADKRFHRNEDGQTERQRGRQTDRQIDTDTWTKRDKECRSRNQELPLHIDRLFGTPQMRVSSLQDSRHHPFSRTLTHGVQVKGHQTGTQTLPTTGAITGREGTFPNDGD